MKITGEINFSLESPSDLQTFLNKASFDYLPELEKGQLTQSGAYIHDVRPYIELLNFVAESMRDAKFLSPDIEPSFYEASQKLSALADEFKKNREIFNRLEV